MVGFPRRRRAAVLVALGCSAATATAGAALKPAAAAARIDRASARPAIQEPSRSVDLVELVTLDPTIRLDIRYATRNNFLGRAVYGAPRALLRRGVAEALVRAHHRLRPRGYGLLIHDAYRPWSVTKLFWEATPATQHAFLANPATGSRHNRGCAVDLTLYELAKGRAVAMPSLYDEMSARSSVGYRGGTRLERTHRDLLRVTMAREGFAVLPSEWWHFDHRSCREYPLLDIAFDTIPPLGDATGRGDP